MDLEIFKTDEDGDKVDEDYFDAISVEFRYHHDRTAPRLRFDFTLPPQEVKAMMLNYYEMKVQQHRQKIRGLELEFTNLKD